MSSGTGKLVPLGVALCVAAWMATADSTAQDLAPGASASRADAEAVASRVGRALRPRLRLGADDGLAVRSTRSDGGRGHHRFRQLYRGLPVFDGSVVANTDAKGALESVHDWRLRDIDVDVTPLVTPEDARALAEQAMEAAGPFDVFRTELGIHTDRELVVKRTGLAPGKGDEELNAGEVEHRVVGHRLAWQVAVRPPDEGIASAQEFTIDALDGRILRRRELTSHATAVGISQYSGIVHLNTTGPGMCGKPFALIDPTRGWSSVAFEYGSAILEDADNTWGDGGPPSNPQFHYPPCASLSFNPDVQTAGVDALHGFSVGWDMYKNVFGQLGYGGFGEPVRMFVHSLASSSSHETDHTLHFVNGTADTPHTAIDSVVHEFTHAVDYVSGPHEYTLKEGIADIFASLGKIYWSGGSPNRGYGSGAHSIPASRDLDDFVMFIDYNDSVRRYLYRPSRTGGLDFYYPGISSEDSPHRAGQPLGRMFYFLSQGASAHVDFDTKDAFRSYSKHLPWGMPGLGPNRAGDILYDAFFNCLASDEYYDARWCALWYALGDPDHIAAVNNAFGGINVGPVDQSYPASPEWRGEIEPNEDGPHATPLTFTRPPDPPFEQVWKAWVNADLDHNGDEDTYSIRVGCQRSLGIHLIPPYATDADVFLFDGNRQLLKPKDPAQPVLGLGEETLWFRPPCMASDPGCACNAGDQVTFFVKVKGKNGASAPGQNYKLRIDAYTDND